MLQNRVDPYGNLIITPARGSWTGNRGVIHNAEKQIVRPFKIKPWITCKLEFKGRQRQVMTPNRWTELFFLDEATAFAAGHRPCAECRREDYNRFKKFWLEGNPEYGFNLKTTIKAIDNVIHTERINKFNKKVTFQQNFAQLPDGVFVEHNNGALLIWKSKLYHWSPFGYHAVGNVPKDAATVLTPRSIVNALAAGYVPQVHQSVANT